MQNETLLIESLKKRESDSLRNVMKAYQDFVYSILLSMLKDTHRAEEATQDTFLKVYKSITSFHGDSKFRTWVYRIAYRTGLDYLKKKKRTKSLDQENVPGEYMKFDEEVTRELERKDLKQGLNVAFTEMKPSDAALLRLFYLKELSMKEISEITGLDTPNIKIRLFRSRQRLKEIILSKSNEVFFPYID